jgi:tight adherence protein B
VSIAPLALLLVALMCFVAGHRASVRRSVLERAGARTESRSDPAAASPRGRRRLLTIVLCALGVIGAYLVAGPVGGVLGAGLALAVPRVLRRRRVSSGRSVLEGQLASAVASVAAALRAGLSLSQAITFAAGEAGPPVSDALRAVAEREELGLSLDESLARWGRESASSDVRLVSDVLRLHIGSGLPLVLDHARHALRERETTRREVRSLTAQARLSGTILGLLPIGFFLFLSVVSHHDMAAAYSSSMGVAAMAAGLVLDGLAFLWIRKLVAVEA